MTDRPLYERPMTEEDAMKHRCCGPDGAGGWHEGDRARWCIGSQCMAWRFEPLLADDAFLTAVKKAAEEIGDTSPQKGKAAKYVTQNRAKYGLPERPFRGYCGLAGGIHS